MLSPGVSPPWKSRFGVGRLCLLCLLATAMGMIAAGLTITFVGMTNVFVPQDLEFMGLSPGQLRAINAHLIPLIAHDRAGFGGGICTCGITVLFSVWCARPSRSLWQVLCLAGTTGFGAAIAIHPIVGYDNLTHLAPAIIGASIFLAGIALTYKPMHASGQPPESEELKKLEVTPVAGS
ncbi:MAG TPA: hypothetical protein VI756_03335 [Blastocatellia bacterium]